MPHRFIVFLLGFALGASSPAPGQPAGPALTLEQCVDIALREHPRVQAAAELVAAAQARINVAKALPQPVFSFDSDLQPGPFQFHNSGESYVGVTQLVEYPGRRTARTEVAAREADQAAADADLVRLGLRYAVTQAFDALLLAREKLTYAEQDLALARDFVEKTEIKYQAGDIAEVEVIRARVEAAQAARAVRAAMSQVAASRAELNVLLVRPAQASLEIAGGLGRLPEGLVDQDVLRETALEARPEIKRLQIELDRLDRERRQAGLANVPDLEVGFSSHRIEGLPRTWDVTLSASIPLFWWQPGKGAIADADARRRAASRDLQALRESVVLEVHQAYLGFVTTRAQIDAFEHDILVPANRVYEMLLFSFQQGELGGIELIDARRTLSQARQAYADTLYDHSAALAALEKSVGRPVRGK